MVLIIVVFASDGLDGWVARKRGSTSQFGAVFDIAGDRIVENALWIIFADLDLIPVWVPLMVMTRGFLVDGLRSLSYVEGMTAFGESNMMRSPLTALAHRRPLHARVLRLGEIRRIRLPHRARCLGVPGHRVTPSSAGCMTSSVLRWFGWTLVWLAVALTIIRAIPVFVDSDGVHPPTGGEGNPQRERVERIPARRTR